MTARCALCMGVLKIFGSTCMTTPTATFHETFNGLFFRSILWKCMQNLNFVALLVPEIIGVLQQIGSPWIRPRSLFSKIFDGLLFGRTPWMYPPNTKFVAVPVPEIIWVPQKCGQYGYICEQFAFCWQSRRKTDIWWIYFSWCMGSGGGLVSGRPSLVCVKF